MENTQIQTVNQLEPERMVKGMTASEYNKWYHHNIVKPKLEANPKLRKKKKKYAKEYYEKNSEVIKKKAAEKYMRTKFN